MDHLGTESEARFQAYVGALIDVIGHADRAEPLSDYCTGLLLPLERKSVEPLAAVTAPQRVSAKHQSLLHFVGKAPWSDERVLAKVRELVVPVIERSGPIKAWIVDDTAFPKKGRHSVGVARQYCGQLGKQDNCQVAVTLSVANDAASLPIAHRLYLPEAWANDAERRAKVGVPEDVVFQTKPEIALDQIRAAQAAALEAAVHERRDIQPDLGHPVDRHWLGTAFRHQADVVGPVRQREFQHLVVQRHLEIQPGLGLRDQAGDVAVLDVAAIFAKMNGDEIGAVVLGHPCGLEDRGILGSARLAQRGDVIDVDSQQRRGHRRFSLNSDGVWSGRPSS